MEEILMLLILQQLLSQGQGQGQGGLFGWLTALFGQRQQQQQPIPPPLPGEQQLPAIYGAANFPLRFAYTPRVGSGALSLEQRSGYVTGDRRRF